MEKFSSPGRIEIVGNHTDHNYGEVMVAAIDLKTTAFAEKNEDGIIEIVSEGYPVFRIELENTSVIKAEYGTSSAIVRGIADGYKKRGLKIGGFSAKINSNIPKGAGVSSSASFELLIAQILNVFYNGGKINRVELAKIAQYAENVYMNKPCGLLDQMGISLGGVTHIDFENPESIKSEKLEFNLPDYQIMITSTGGDHSNLTYAYSAIKDEMHEVAGFFGKKFLREVDEAHFYNDLSELSKAVSGRAILRAAHFYDENQRVRSAVNAIKNNDLNQFFSCVKESGESSYKLLQNCHTETDLAQRIPLALFLSSRLLKKGAYRVHGGGFAGTILAFVHNSEMKVYHKIMSEVFGADNIFITNIDPQGAR